MKKIKDPIKQILDENNKENIILYDPDGKEIEFEQVALIPLEETKLLYAILIPTTPMQGVNAGEGVLFAIDEEKYDLSLVTDEKIIDKVLEVYKEIIGDDSDE